MKIREENGIYGTGKIYTLETLKDWDEYEKLCKERTHDHILNWCPGFYQIKEKFKEYIGRVWDDKENLRYMYNGVPVYKSYFIIGIEDNVPFADWYWILQNIDDTEDIKYMLVNDPNFKNGLR